MSGLLPLAACQRRGSGQAMPGAAGFRGGWLFNTPPFQALCHLQRAERKGVFTLVKINDNSTSGFGGLVT